MPQQAGSGASRWAPAQQTLISLGTPTRTGTRFARRLVHTQVKTYCKSNPQVSTASYQASVMVCSMHEYVCVLGYPHHEAAAGLRCVSTDVHVVVPCRWAHTREERAASAAALVSQQHPGSLRVSQPGSVGGWLTAVRMQRKSMRRK